MGFANAWTPHHPRQGGFRLFLEWAIAQQKVEGSLNWPAKYVEDSQKNSAGSGAYVK
jgi:hypothetical protein